MKRLLGLCIGILMTVVIMSMPVCAAVDIGGQVFFDTYYYHQDKEGFSRTGWTGVKTQPGSGGLGGIPKGSVANSDDRNQTYMDLNHATALRFHWFNQEGLGMFTVIYMNADPGQSAGTDPGFKVGVSIATLYYDIFKDLRLTVGRGGFTQVFSPFDPQTYMGYDGVCKVEGLGYGNINSKYQDGIRLTYKFVPFAAIDVEFLMPRLTADTEVMGGPGFVAKAGQSIDNVSKIPKIEVGLPFTYAGSWGKVAFTPSAMYLKQQFNNVAAGDDSATSYGLSAGAMIDIFGVKLMGEYNYGQNLYTASRIGEATVYPFKYEYITGGFRNAMGARVLNSALYDSKTHAFWVQAGYNIMGRVAPTVFYGRNQTKRDMPDAFVPGNIPKGLDPNYGNTDFTTQFYGINIPVTITKNFKVVPEFMIYDNGSSNKVNGVEYNYGKEWLAGVEFQLTF